MTQEFVHEPVLLAEVLENLKVRPDGVYVDGTLGGAGHASKVCELLSEEGVFIGIDRDCDALEAAGPRLEKYPCKKYLIHDNFANIKSVLEDLGIGAIDGALLDLGVSSYQLDNAERGFSYMQDAPLDMRMDQSEDFTAYDVVNGYTKEQLTDIIRKYGEERWASRIADFIVKDRKEAPIETSSQLVGTIKKAIPKGARKDGPHPAKRTFQALRIEVNDELAILGRACEDFLDVMAPEGRLCVITFHSLEDRIVKGVMNTRANPCTCPPDLPQCICGKVADIKKVTGKPLEASEEELERNPRSRSAKLRVCEKL